MKREKAMYMPRVKSARPKHYYKIGRFNAVFLDEIKSEGDVEYEYIITVFGSNKDEAFLFITSERNNLGLFKEMGASNFLCIFDEAGHRNLGSSPDWANADKFETAAFKILEKRLGYKPVKQRHRGSLRDEKVAAAKKEASQNILSFYCPNCGRLTRYYQHQKPFGRKKQCKGCHIYFFLEQKNMAPPENENLISITGHSIKPTLEEQRYYSSPPQKQKSLPFPKYTDPYSDSEMSMRNQSSISIGSDHFLFKLAAAAEAEETNLNGQIRQAEDSDSKHETFSPNVEKIRYFYKMLGHFTKKTLICLVWTFVFNVVLSFLLVLYLGFSLAIKNQGTPQQQLQQKIQQGLIDFSSEYSAWICLACFVFAIIGTVSAALPGTRHCVSA